MQTDQEIASHIKAIAKVRWWEEKNIAFPRLPTRAPALSFRKRPIAASLRARTTTKRNARGCTNIMGNVSYQLDRIEDGIAYLTETCDLTDRSGPGILMRYGRQVDCEHEGIVSAWRSIRMPYEQAIELGLIKGG